MGVLNSDSRVYNRYKIEWRYISINIVIKNMGNIISPICFAAPPALSERDNMCLICWEECEPYAEAQCIQCNIVLHRACEERYRGDKGYCKCPHCNGIGTIASVGL